MEMLKDIRAQVERLKGRKEAVQSDRDRAQKKKEALSIEVKNSEAAKAIIRLVAQKTQNQLKDKLEIPVSLAMSAVFERSCNLRIEFPERRGRTECDFFWNVDGYEYPDLEFSEGGGALDVAAFGLQMAILSLMKNHSRQVLFLDEPLKWLKGGELPERGAMMLSEISKSLGIQIVMVSHIPEQRAGSDKVFEIKMDKKGVSNVHTIE